MPQLIAEKSTEIHAPVEKVWDVLVKPEYIRQWDEVPEDFTQDQISSDSELIWTYGEDNKEFTKLSVTNYEP